jgi:hypothetical protein
MPTRSPEEIRGSIERTRAELVSSVDELRVRWEVMTDWRRQISEHRTIAIVAAAGVGFLVGRRLFRRRE